MTTTGPVLIETVKNDAKTTRDLLQRLLEKLQKQGIAYLDNNFVAIDSYGRLNIAIKAISLGADFETVARMLLWREFEEIAATALKRAGYIVTKNLRFKQGERKWEIDIVGCRKPIVLCIDCKHWQRRISPAALCKITEAQVERTRNLAATLPHASLKLECTKWEQAKFIPIILLLVPASFKFYDDVPIVPVLQSQDFLNQLPLHIESLKYFTKSFNHLSKDNNGVLANFTGE
ncbi:MAG: nuclease-related domain-containing protein [Candidatus Bathyarchaeia archaeon]